MKNETITITINYDKATGKTTVEISEPMQTHEYIGLLESVKITAVNESFKTQKK